MFSPDSLVSIFPKEFLIKPLIINTNPVNNSDIATVDASALASTVAISELLTGLVLIISGFIKNSFGNILTRLSGLNITILMITILIFAHKDWFFTTKLFTSEQIFLLIGGVYFLIKGNRT